MKEKNAVTTDVVGLVVSAPSFQTRLATYLGNVNVYVIALALNVETMVVEEFAEHVTRTRVAVMAAVSMGKFAMEENAVCQIAPIAIAVMMVAGDRAEPVLSTRTPSVTQPDIAIAR